MQNAFLHAMKVLELKRSMHCLNEANQGFCFKRSTFQCFMMKRFFVMVLRPNGFKNRMLTCLFPVGFK